MIKGVKFINEHERHIRGCLVPIEERVESLGAVRGYLKERERSFCIKVQTLLPSTSVLIVKFFLRCRRYEGTLPILLAGRFRK